MHQLIMIFHIRVIKKSCVQKKTTPAIVNPPKEKGLHLFCFAHHSLLFVLAPTNQLSAATIMSDGIH
jgi:hypothetical protein